MIIYYHTSQTIDGQTSYCVYKDVADANGSAMYLNGVKLSGGNPTVTDWTPEVSCHSVQLVGYELSHTSCDVATATVSALGSGTDAEKIDWLIAHDKSLRPALRGGVTLAGGNPRIGGDSFALVSLSVVDASTGAAVSLSAYPRELTSNALPSWTGMDTVKAIVQAKVTFDHYADDGRIVKNNKVTREVHQAVTLTNATTRTYSTVQSSGSAETVPQNVAESAYRSAAATQHAGAIELLSTTNRSDIHVGVRLTLVGPNTTFTNCLVQGVTAQPQRGYIKATFGPCAPIDVDAWIALARSFWSRTTYAMPSGRADGGGVSANALDQTATAAGDNTSHGVGSSSVFAAVYTRPSS